jgi:hypothetical protein
MEQSPKPRQVTLRRARMGAEEAALDREFWARLSPAERIEETWRLTVEQWTLHGWDPGEPGLCRSVARVVRR